MTTLSSFSSMTTMLQTSRLIWQTVNLTDELKINLQYDINRNSLNISVKNTGDNKDLSCCLNVLPTPQDEIKSTSCQISSDLLEQDDENEAKICYELSTTYVYDIIDENEANDQTDLSQTKITFSSSSSSSFSCFDDQTTDNDDGYSTHSLDDIEQQSVMIPSPKSIVPALYHHYYYYSEQYVSPICRLIGQLTWQNRFKKTIRDMMRMNHLF
ncbi:unnamed protein product [Adineta ricciae]|uniref:Uncharacterized protein n=1 Tax=Adineta ricciae TaxID=249248 RepID=A0A814SZ50_ADIRI|nr:unnamed protein product [Adineta ricciae]CAF1154881.1 unnamed protein product [Adineta ricciae]